MLDKIPPLKSTLEPVVRMTSYLPGPVNLDGREKQNLIMTLL